jgi:uncharacterized membrane protein YidH (DUF202 family)
MASLGKTLILLGIALAAIGAIIWAGAEVPIVGRLPGDFYLKRGNWSFYFPLTTCIVLSVVLTLLMSLLRR